MKGAHLPSAECRRWSPRRLGASLAFSVCLRRLTPPIIWGRSFCGVAELKLVECIKMILGNHPVVGHSLRHWGVMNLVKPLKSCHYFGMILQFKGSSLYQIVAKNYFWQMCISYITSVQSVIWCQPWNTKNLHTGMQQAQFNVINIDLGFSELIVLGLLNF